MKHFPNRLITLQSKLTLHLRCGETVLRRCKQMNGGKPCQQRQLRTMDHGVGSEAGLMPALFADPAFLVLVPVVPFAATLLTYNSIVLTSLSEVILAVLFTLKPFAKLCYLHCCTDLVYGKGRVWLYLNSIHAKILGAFADNHFYFYSIEII